VSANGPSQSRRALEASVALREEELARAISGLRESAELGVRLRRGVSARPWGWLAAAFVLGFALGTRR